MARTLIGRLQLVVQAMGLGEAKRVEGSIRSIEGAAKRLSAAPWGVNFQRQIDKLGLSATQINKVRASWNNLERDLAARGLAGAMRKSELTAWKTATMGNLAAVRASMRETEQEARRIGRGIRSALKPAHVMAGSYSAAYLGGTLGREAITASSERQREYFRQRMADIPEGEREQIFEKSQTLGNRYRSINITDIMEMARTARNTMGTTERGMQILEQMVRGHVALQSVKGVEAAPTEMTGLLRGLDNLGKNSNGDLGVQNVNNLIDAFIRASQIEGNDFDVGSMWAFARRSRIGGPGLNSEFLATVAPAMIQDMGPDGAGTALNMAYKAFVIGANDGASKVNLAEQKRLGLRSGDGKGDLVDADLFGTNPYEWVKKNLIPALKKDGVDVNNETAVAKSVAELSRNSSATGFLTRMITQMEQFDRLISLYNRGMGTEAADQAAESDPNVSWKGFNESLRNLSAAVGENVMPVIVPALNSFASTINSFSEMVKKGDPTVMGIGGAAAAGAGAFAVWKTGAAIYGLITAGTNLNIAAAALQAAALAQGGAGVAGNAGKMASSAATGGGLMGLLKSGAMRAGGLYTLAGLVTYKALEAKGGDPARATPQGTIEQDNAHRLYGPGAQVTAADMAARDNRLRPTNPVDFDAVLAQAADAGTKMGQALSVQATPSVDKSQIDAAAAAAERLRALLQGIGPMAAAAASAVEAQVRRTHSDYGVVP